jgi:protein FAM32A
MPADEYTSIPSTGKLKLKGVKDSKVSKKKKTRSARDEKPSDEVQDNSVMLKKLEDEDREIAREETGKQGKTLEEGNDGEQGEEPEMRVKTEAERRYEEQRRKRVCVSNFLPCQIQRAANVHYRKVVIMLDANDLSILQLDDRLKREGVKTHKQRVEELNRYLSGLSEHHDMPRIGPG